MTPSQVFYALLNRYGPQGWWPVTEENENLPRYSNGPKNEKQQLEVIFGTILMQNTAWNNAQKALINLHKNKLIDIEKIKSINVAKLANIIQSSGYYNQKAKKLNSICGFLLKNPIAELQKLDAQSARILLLSVKGVGPETADSILLYALNKPIFVVDAYTKRIFSRLGICKENAPYATLQEIFHDSIKPDSKVYNEFHALIVEHAKQHCKKKPLCNDCPLLDQCQKNLNP